MRHPLFYTVYRIGGFLMDYQAGKDTYSYHCFDFSGIKASLPKKEKKNRYVCLDIEMSELNSCERQMTCGMRNEIIQIGAVMLDENFNMISQFQTYVKPKFSSITPTIYNLTGITDEKLEHADDFITAFDKYCYWLGDNKVTTFCWSKTDYIQLWDELHLKARHRDDLFESLKSFVDLQDIFCRLLGARVSVSLESALRFMQLDFEGQVHTANCDAYNTGRILHKIFCSENLEPEYEYLDYQKDSGKQPSKAVKKNSVQKDSYNTSFASFLSPELQKLYGYLSEEETVEEEAEEEITEDSLSISESVLAGQVDEDVIKALCGKYKVRVSDWISFAVEVMNTDEMLSA